MTRVGQEPSRTVELIEGEAPEIEESPEVVPKSEPQENEPSTEGGIIKPTLDDIFNVSGNLGKLPEILENMHDPDKLDYQPHKIEGTDVGYIYQYHKDVGFCDNERNITINTRYFPVEQGLLLYQYIIPNFGQVKTFTEIRGIQIGAREFRVPVSTKVPKGSGERTIIARVYRTLTEDEKKPIIRELKKEYKQIELNILKTKLKFDFDDGYTLLV